MPVEPEILNAALADRDKVLEELEAKMEATEQQVAMLIVSYGEVAIFAESVLEHLFKYLPEAQRGELLKAMNERRTQMLETLNNGGITTKEPEEEKDTDDPEPDEGAGC